MMRRYNVTLLHQQYVSRVADEVWQTSIVFTRKQPEIFTNIQILTRKQPREIFEIFSRGSKYCDFSSITSISMYFGNVYVWSFMKPLKRRTSGWRCSKGMNSMFSSNGWIVEKTQSILLQNVVVVTNLRFLEYFDTACICTALHRQTLGVKRNWIQLKVERSGYIPRTIWMVYQLENCLI